MTGGFCRSSEVVSGGYDEYDIFTGTGLVASGRRLLNGARDFFNKHVRNRVALDLIMVQPKWIWRTIIDATGSRTGKRDCTSLCVRARRLEIIPTAVVERVGMIQKNDYQ